MVLRRAVATVSILSALLASAACAAKNPPRWAEGGQPLVLQRARWDRGGEVVDLLPDGRVVVDGEHTFTVDAAGRVFQPSHEPVAVLQPDGHLRGPDNKDMGMVGMTSAAPEGQKFAWVVVGPDGSVTTFTDEGVAKPSGGWSGCFGPAVRTCTLVSHLLVERQMARSGSGPRFGIGIGVIVPIR